MKAAHQVKLLCMASLGIGLISGTCHGAGIKLLSSPDAPGWMFRAGTGIRAMVKFDRPLSAAPAVELIDFDGRSTAIPVESFAGTSATVSLTPERGYYVLKASAKGAGTVKQSLAVLPPAPEIIPESPFGVNFHLTRVTPAEAERELALAEFIGFSWARGVPCDWIDLKEKDYHPILKRRKNFYKILEKSKLSMLGGILFVPRWASGAPKGVEGRIWSRVIPDDLSILHRVARDLATALPFIQYWEIGNEVDSEQFWRGRWKHYLAGDDEAIMQDYVDFLATAAAGLREGKPGIKILYAGLTSWAPDGKTYRPFLSATLKQGAAKHYDIMNVHYHSNLDNVQRVMNEQKVPAVPIWITEAGGSAAGHGRNERTQVVADLTQFVEQLAAGAQKVFKYDFRNDGVNPNDPEHHYGMVCRNFSPKPNYVSAATMIEQLAGTCFEQELNIVASARRGWMKGFRFRAPGSKRPVNVLWLKDAPNTSVTLKTPDDALTLVDVMGRRTELPVSGGKVTLPVSELPFYLLGNITSEPGKPIYPADRLIRTIPVRLQNPGFEQGLAGWHHTFRKAEVRTTSDAYSGKRAAVVHLSGGGEEDFYSLYQRIDLKPYLSQLKPGEYLKLGASAQISRRQITGRGILLSIPFINEKKIRAGYKETSYRPGNHGYRETVLDAVRIPRGVVTSGIDFYAAPQTTGTFAVDHVTLTLEVWRTPGY